MDLMMPVFKGKIFPEVEPTFKWGERRVKERKRSPCDYTLRLTQHKPAVIPFQASI